MGTHDTSRPREFSLPRVREILREDPGSEPPPDHRAEAAQQRRLVAASLLTNPDARR